MRAFNFMVIVVAALLLQLHPASAQRAYIEAHGGLNIAFDSDIDDPTGVFDSLSYDPGFAVGGAVGYQLNPNFRFEGEITYRRNELDEFEVSGSNFNADGEVDSVAFMANAFFDFANSTPWTPYLGAGLGVAVVEWDDVEVLGGKAIDDQDTVFAFQVGAGLGFEVTPNTTLSLDYRFFGTTDAHITDEAGDNDDISYLNSSVWLGLRFAF